MPFPLIREDLALHGNTMFGLDLLIFLKPSPNLLGLCFFHGQPHVKSQKGCMELLGLLLLQYLDEMTTCNFVVGRRTRLVILEKEPACIRELNYFHYLWLER